MYIFTWLFTCLLHNLLRCEDETNINQLFQVIKLKATLDEGAEIHVQDNTINPSVQTHIEG
jgi:hypothetical protein